MAPASSWRVLIPTADETCVRVRCREPAGKGPWPLSRALVELGHLGLQPEERFRSLGAGRGQPLLQSQEASWHELPVHLESLVTAGGRLVEAALALPAMEELIARVDESSWWELVDVFAAACDAAHGAVVDGEPLELEPAADAAGWRSRLADHLALLVPGRFADQLPPAGAVYTSLPMSSLTVVLH